ncbi:MAG: hypothetical protein ACK5V3_08330 [Bdellovibrionales bacterium]
MEPVSSAHHNKLKHLFFKVIALSGILAQLGCSAVKFSTKSNCDNESNCISQQGFDVYEGRESIGGGKVDLLFVNDNSASMSFEQARLSQRLNLFVSRFDQRFIDYRMAVVTSDISSPQNPARSINQNGALQDGKLIKFSNGASFLIPSSGTASQKELMFKQVINRTETLSCENFIQSWIASGKSRETSEYASAYAINCPSTDERGIFSANLVVKNNSDSFIRQEADLHIVFLADEDVRSQLYWNNTPGFSLEDFDRGDKLLPNIRSIYPQKTVGIHAIIVQDASCLAEQGSQLSGVVSGSYGWEYHKATQSTSGVSANICASDYSQQLQAIFDNIQGNILDKISLKCSGANLELENVTISSSDTSITYSIVGAEIRFNKKLPVGSSVYYKYKCKQTSQ